MEEGKATAIQKFGKLKHVSVEWRWLSGDIRFRNGLGELKLKKGWGIILYFSHGLHYLEHFAGEIVEQKLCLNIRLKILMMVSPALICL